MPACLYPQVIATAPWDPLSPFFSSLESRLFLARALKDPGVLLLIRPSPSMIFNAFLALDLLLSGNPYFKNEILSSCRSLNNG